MGNSLDVPHPADRTKKHRGFAGIGWARGKAQPAPAIPPWLAPAAPHRQKGPSFPGATPYMTIRAVEFASLLCSRLCHDLLSPVGALNIGLELLAAEHDPEMRQRCLDLLNASARASAN